MCMFYTCSKQFTACNSKRMPRRFIASLPYFGGSIPIGPTMSDRHVKVRLISPQIDEEGLAALHQQPSNDIRLHQNIHTVPKASIQSFRRRYTNSLDITS